MSILRNGIEYKIGRHGLVFRKALNGDWLKSNLSIEEVTSGKAETSVSDAGIGRVRTPGSRSRVVRA